MLLKKSYLEKHYRIISRQPIIYRLNKYRLINIFYLRPPPELLLLPLLPDEDLLLLLLPPLEDLLLLLLPEERDIEEDDELLVGVL